MKIYQIHEHSGEWEDYRDYIVGSYLSKERAEAEKEQFEKEELEERKCRKCPAIFNDRRYDYKDINIKEYCSRYEPFEEGKHDEDEIGARECVNYSYPWNDCRYEIEEVEVIE